MANQFQPCLSPRIPPMKTAGDLANEDLETLQIKAVLDVVGSLDLPIVGTSMGKRWNAYERARLSSPSERRPEIGDVIIFSRGGRLVAHRVLARLWGRYITKGDARWTFDRPFPTDENVIGVVTALFPGGACPRSKSRAFFEGFKAIAASPIWLFFQRQIGRGRPPA